jgi:hypothetical protein
VTHLHSGPARSVFGCGRWGLPWAVLVWVACVLAPGAAEAEEGKPELRVLLVVDRSNDPAIERIRAEVAALGLTIVSRPPSGPLEADARAQHAVAAIRALPSRKGVELWMADVTTGRTLTRQLVVDEDPTGPDYNLVALQTAEILRTSLLHKNDDPTPADKTRVPEPSAPVVVAAPSPAPSARIETAAALGSLYSVGGVGPALQAWMSVRRRSLRGFGVGLDFSVPVVRGSLSGIEGSSKVGVFSAGIALSKSFLGDTSRGYLGLGLGGGVVYIKSTGEAQAPLAGGSASAMVGQAYASAEAGWRPSSSILLGVTLLGGTAFKGVTIDFVGNRAGTFGRLLLGGAVGLTVVFD